jgi:4-amino-4-deoxy-L-arabinose transferase-like glycosyltransferase
MGEYGHPEASEQQTWRTKPDFCVLFPVLIFLAVVAFMPLRTAVQIGADEGFELAKATLCLKGHELYTEIWNDQPPLHTFLITKALKHISPSVLVPRLITAGFAAILLASVFLVIRRMSGATTATIASLLLLCSPGFVELSASCMLEIPSLAVAVAGIALLVIVPPCKLRLDALLGGCVFGLALGMKLVPVILGPVLLLFSFIQAREYGKSRAFFALSLAVFALSGATSFLLMDLLIEKGAYLAHFRQSWVSHFGAAASLEYGSAADHPFEWLILFRDWDMTVPALVGIGVLIRDVRRDLKALIPLAWLGLMLVVFIIHRPWWSYYYVHIALPLAWCAAVGWVRMVGFAAVKVCNAAPLTFASLCRRWFFSSLVLVLALATSSWMLGRVYLQVSEARRSPKISSTPVLAELRRYRFQAENLFTDATVYSFHSGIPLPPSLAVLPLKRFWSGEMTIALLSSELEQIHPSLILLPNDSRELPYREWLLSQYRLVYQDDAHLLYLRRNSIRGLR